jgi:hypothetical protein
VEKGEGLPGAQQALPGGVLVEEDRHPLLGERAPFESQAACAFSISCSDFIDHKSFQHYFDYLRERILTLGYRPHRSERELLDRVLYVETVERHSFRLPDLANDHGKMIQLYGHVYLELIRVNDRPSYLRLMVTKVVDSRFAAPLPFEDLMNRVMV